MTIIRILASLLIGGAFIAVTWDNKNHWKVFACALAMTVGIIFSGISAYDRGYEDATCYIYEQISEKNGRTVASLEEECDE